MDHPTPTDTAPTVPVSRAPVWDRLPQEPPYEPGELPIGGASPWIDRDVTAPIPAPARTAPRRGGWLQTVAAAAIGGALVLVGVQVIGSDSPQENATDVSAATIGAPVTTQGPAPELADVADASAIGRAVIPSLVTVQVSDSGSGEFTPFATGSGVVLDAAGYIVTNHHVIADGSTFRVVLSDGRTSYPATLVGSDALTDLAVLSIAAPDLTAIRLGSTTELEVGDPAIAVGSPLGLEGGPSLTVGVVSAFDRRVQLSGEDQLFGMLQTDAPITQGSSGGALVDSAGRLIGITTAVGVSDVGIEGIGFATPVELMKRVTDELIAHGSVSHALLGINGTTYFRTSESGASVAVGVQVTSVVPGSGASTAGLSTGEIITAVEGETITRMEDLITTLRYMSAGDEITVDVSDGTSTRAIDLTLGERDD